MTNHAQLGHEAIVPTPHTVKDPVCGMDVDPHTTQHHSEHQGHAYHFCSENCKIKFEGNPDQYVHASEGPDQEVEVAVGDVAEYTCPMHPEIRRAGPGACPICGMALEPVVISAGNGPNPELVDMSRRFWIGLILAIPVVLLEMGTHLFRHSTTSSPPRHPSGFSSYSRRRWCSGRVRCSSSEAGTRCER